MSELASTPAGQCVQIIGREIEKYVLPPNTSPREAYHLIAAAGAVDLVVESIKDDEASHREEVMWIIWLNPDPDYRDIMAIRKYLTDLLERIA